MSDNCIDECKAECKDASLLPTPLRPHPQTWELFERARRQPDPDLLPKRHANRHLTHRRIAMIPYTSTQMIRVMNTDLAQMMERNRWQRARPEVYSTDRHWFTRLLRRRRPTFG